MAFDDATLMAEVRTLTGYDDDLLDDTDLLNVVMLAKEEVRAEVDDFTISFFSGNGQADRALFWLTCIFSKITMGEFDAPHMTVSELKIRQAGMDERTGLWFQKFNQRLDALRGPRMGHTTVSRTDRTYEFEN